MQVLTSLECKCFVCTSKPSLELLNDSGEPFFHHIAKGPENSVIMGIPSSIDAACHKTSLPVLR